MLSGKIPLVNVCSYLLSFHVAKVQRNWVTTKFFSKKNTKKHFVKNHQSLLQNISSCLQLSSPSATTAACTPASVWSPLWGTWRGRAATHLRKGVYLIQVKTSCCTCWVLQRCSVAVKKQMIPKQIITLYLYIYLYIYKYSTISWVWRYPFENCNTATLQRCAGYFEEITKKIFFLQNIREPQWNIVTFAASKWRRWQDGH